MAASRKPCRVCGGTVPRGVWLRRCCSDECLLVWLPKCQQCGAVVTNPQSRFCSVDCKSQASRKPRGGRRKPSKVRHDARALQVGGLTKVQRAQLLAKWKRQGRMCAYCLTTPVDTLDHVVPLARGGDNFEGNTVGACRKCNSSKCDMLLTEWRMGKGTGASVSRWWRAPVKRRRRPIRGAQIAMQTCYICGELHAGSTVTCGDRHCQREHAGRLARDRYRAKVGIPVNPREPTAYWARLTGAALAPDRYRRAAA